MANNTYAINNKPCAIPTISTKIGSFSIYFTGMAIPKSNKSEILGLFGNFQNG